MYISKYYIEEKTRDPNLIIPIRLGSRKDKRVLICDYPEKSYALLIQEIRALKMVGGTSQMWPINFKTEEKRIKILEEGSGRMAMSESGTVAGGTIKIIGGLGTFPRNTVLKWRVSTGNKSGVDMLKWIVTSPFTKKGVEGTIQRLK